MTVEQIMAIYRKVHGERNVPADATFHSALLTAEGVMRQCKNAAALLKEARETYDKTAKSFASEIDRAQTRCVHPHKETHVPPAGTGDDPTTQCTICGKYL